VLEVIEMSEATKAPTQTIELPTRVFERLQALAAEEQLGLSEMLDSLVKQAEQRRAWLRDLDALREQIRKEGHLLQGKSEDEVVEQLRRTREEIWDAEYAHLYR
jgi:hypothetical protein